MQKRVASILPLAAGLISAIGALPAFPPRAALAADDCLTEPNLRTAQKGHWYYRIDRAGNRKCWYLRRLDAEAPPAASPQPQSPPGTAAQSASWISRLALTFAPASAPQQQETVAEPSAQRIPADVAGKDAALPTEEPRLARHLDAEKKTKTRQQRASRTPVTQPDRNAAFDPASRDALFQEFLLWQGRQATQQTTVDETGREALFREFLIWQARQRGNEP